MSFPDLRAFLDQLRRDGDLVTVDAEVDANQEAAEIHRRVIAAGGPALLFTNVRGKAFPLVTNLFGTPRRAELAFGTRPLAADQAHRRAGRDADAADARQAVGRTRRRARGAAHRAQARRARPRARRRRAARRWIACRRSRAGPRTAGPFVTLPLVYTEHPDGKGHNLGMYRLHIHDGQTTGMHWQIGKGGGFHYQLAESRGKALPVSVFVGGPPGADPRRRSRRCRRTSPS